jgi:hypothetical protein
MRQMAEPEDVVDNVKARTSALFVIEAEWPYFQDRIQSLNSKIKAKLKNNKEAGKRLDEAFNTLSSVMKLIIPDDDYKQRESSSLFRLSMMGLDDCFKSLCKAYIEEEGLLEEFKENSDSDNLEHLFRFFYDKLSVKRSPTITIEQKPREWKKQGFEKRDRNEKSLLYAYPAVTRIIRFVRNIEVVHDIQKPSYLSKLTSFDNVYTLTSIVTLTFYGFVEMLEVWDETIEIETARLA